jgi:hypothetical protein
VSSPPENFSVENLASWEDAIRKAKSKINRLKMAIRVFEESMKHGEPWPGTQSENAATRN